LKVASPSCGGLSNNKTTRELYNKSLSDVVNLEQITCPLFFMAPANDFHGNIADLPAAVELIQSPDFRVSSAPHHNHQDAGEFMASSYLFLDHYLQGKPALPETPVLELKVLSNQSPSATVKVDTSRPIKSVDVFYTQQGVPSSIVNDAHNPRFKFWQHQSVELQGSEGQVELPIMNASAPLWAYVNVEYEAPETVESTNYYYAPFTSDTMVVSSVLTILTSEDIKELAPLASLKPSLVVESFGESWKQDWFTYDPANYWSYKTNKLYSPLYQAPNDNAKLSLALVSKEANTLALRIDQHVAEYKLEGSEEVQTVTLSCRDFKNAAKEPMKSWKSIRQLELAPIINISSRFNHNGIVSTERLRVGSQNWKGEEPAFQELKWVE